MLKDMWMVVDSEDGVILTTDDYEEALDSYYKAKERHEDYVNNSGEFEGNEQVILAKIEKHFYAYETDKKDEEGNNFWRWNEFENQST